MSKKVRSDSVLKKLPELSQEKLIEFMRGHSLADTVKFVRKEFGESTSVASLSEFWHWWHLARRLELTAKATTDLAQVLKELPSLNLNDKQLEDAAQAMFEAQAVTQGDAKLFLGLKEMRHGDQWIQLEREKLELSEKKFMFSAAKAILKHAGKIRPIVDGPGTDDEKTEKLGQIIFGEEWT